MRARRLALTAAAFAVLSLLSVVAFWVVIPAWPNLGDFGYALLMTIFGACASVLAIGLLVTPVLTGRGARYQRPLAFLATLGIASLLVLYLPCAMLLEFGDGFGALFSILEVLAGTALCSILLSLTFAVATLTVSAPRKTRLTLHSAG